MRSQYRGKKFHLDNADTWLRVQGEVGIGAFLYSDGGRGPAICDGEISDPDPMGCLKYYWILFKNDADDLIEFLPILKNVVRRGMIPSWKQRSAVERMPWSYMQAAMLFVLLKDDAILRDGAELLASADDAEQAGVQSLALSGLIRASVMGDEDARAKQGEILLTYPMERTWRWPGRALTRAFLLRDTKKFEKQMKEDVEKHWKIIEHCKYNPYFERDGKVFVTIKMLPLYHMWPWPEAVFALLLMRDSEWRPSFKSEWLPAKIIDPEFGRS